MRVAQSNRIAPQVLTSFVILSEARWSRRISERWTLSTGVAGRKLVFCFSKQPAPSAGADEGVYKGWVAQLAEQWTENPRVAGSIPAPATFLIQTVSIILVS